MNNMDLYKGDTMEKYKKNEFCKDKKCEYYKGSCSAHHTFMCPYTAKTFHEWLKGRGYIIIKAPRMDVFKGKKDKTQKKQQEIINRMFLK